MSPKRGCVTAESPFGGTDRTALTRLPREWGPGQPPITAKQCSKMSLCPQVCHYLGVFWQRIPLLGKTQTGGRVPRYVPAMSSHCGRSVFAIQTGMCLRFGGGWRVGALPVACRDPGLSVPVLQGGSTSEQTSERENLSWEGRFLGSAFQSFCSGCLDAPLHVLINVSGGKSPPVPHSPSKEGKEAVQDICPHFLILNFSINSPGSPAPKPAGRKI